MTIGCKNIECGEKNADESALTGTQLDKKRKLDGKTSSRENVARLIWKCPCCLAKYWKEKA